MTSVNLHQLELNEFIAIKDPLQHCRATFPLVGFHGSKQLATVYFELAPGEHLGRHTDSAEELLVILEGKGITTIGEEKSEAGKGTLVLVPEMAPHDIHNNGATTLKVLGIFGGANNIIATFEKEMLPTKTNVVDTALLFR